MRMILKIIIIIMRLPMRRPGLLHATLAHRGFRLTLSREAILNVFRKDRKHLSAEDVFFAVRKKYPGIGFATVYRTLDLLTRMGLVLKFDFGDGRSRYELASQASKGHHHHMICRRCGRIIDYSDFMDEEVKFIKDLEAELSRKHNFKINSHQIHFYGLCRECQ
jgi:Fur family ferric uptake transcriptional regulator